MHWVGARWSKMGGHGKMHLHLPDCHWVSEKNRLWGKMETGNKASEGHEMKPGHSATHFIWRCYNLIAFIITLPLLGIQTTPILQIN